MSTLIKSCYHIARKTYHCDASSVLLDDANISDYKKEDQEIILKHKERGFKIFPGDRYCINSLSMVVMLCKSDVYLN